MSDDDPFDRTPDIWWGDSYDDRFAYWFFDGEWHGRTYKDGVVAHESVGPP